MRPIIGYIITAAFAGLNAVTISVLGFAPQAVVTTSVAHQPAAPHPQSVSIMFVGDLMLDRHVREWMSSSGPEYPFARLGTITGAAPPDLLVGNLEGAISIRRPPEKSIDFAFDASVAPLLRKNGFGAFSLANNHSLDQGFPGYEDTKKRLADAGLSYFGHQVKDDLPATIREAKGRRVALFGYNITDNPLEEKVAAKAIKDARGSADLVMVMMHWGTEYDLKQNSAQSALAHRLIDYGADAVIGAHPHVVQGLEIYKSKPIIYSLGNFIFDQYFSDDTQQGIAVAFTFGNKTTLTVIPVAIVQSQPRRMEGEPARKFLTALLGRSVISKDILSGSVDHLIRGLDRGVLVLTW